MDFFATAAKGTEPALRDELRELRVPGIRADRGGVHFQGELDDAARVCLWSRIAVRVLIPIAEFPAHNAQALYSGARTVEWERWISPRHTLAVKANTRDGELTHTQFIAQKTKDAIVDRLRDRFSTRPSVDLENPDLRVQVHMVKNRATLYMDASGESLHMRGWRIAQGAAPLKETLAAAIVRMAGFRVGMPVLDPMCGAGTLAIEAAMWSENRAPGLGRATFGFERWATHDDAARERMRVMRDEARNAVRPPSAPVLAWDIDADAISAATRNAVRAGVKVDVKRNDIRQFKRENVPTETGLLVTNPPYGERIEGDRPLYDAMARAFVQLPGWDVAVLSGGPEIEMAFNELRFTAPPHALFNGPIECRLLRFKGPRPPAEPRAPREPRPMGDVRGPREYQGPRDPRGPRDGRGPRDFQGPRDPRGPREFQGPRDPRGPREFQGPRDPRGPREFQGPRGPRDARDTRGPRDTRGQGDARGPRDARDARGPREGGGGSGGGTGGGGPRPWRPREQGNAQGDQRPRDRNSTSKQRS